MIRSSRAASLLVGALAMLGTSTAQEHKELGRMWTLEDAPLGFFEQEYGFRPTDKWLDHVRLSALRYGNFCSASFVSPRGLIMTNHHCARDNVDTEMKKREADWLTNGFFASKLEDEIPIEGLRVSQLVATADITERMNEGITEDMDDAAIQNQIRMNWRAVRKDFREQSPELRHERVTMYQGGNYQVYSYKDYEDVRLVATPQIQIAKFGGDPDNFTFPRFCLDFALVRAWEDDKPADTSGHYFKWRTEGPTDGETVFVIGNPGSTGRLKTVAQIEFLRDYFYPPRVQMVKRMLDQLYQRVEGNPEAKKQNISQILNLENARKAFTGYLDGLQNEKVVDIKRKAEEDILEKVEADPELKAKYADAWTRLAEIQDRMRQAIQDRDQAALQQLSAEEAVQEKRVGEAFFAVYGTSIPPDATMTLRISDGVTKGFPMNGTIAPYFTSLYGLYGRYTEFGGKEPFDLPDNWVKAASKLDLTTPFNLVSTCDIIGGNSGSPMIDADARVVGLVFDGNIESLGNNYVFTDDVPRTVCVHPAIIIEALRKVYDAKKIADELEGKGKGYK